MKRFFPAGASRRFSGAFPPDRIFPQKHTCAALLLASLLLLCGCSPRASGGRHSYTDQSAPKVIRSKEIESFDCSFRPPVYEHNGYVDSDSLCRFTMEKKEGNCVCTAAGSAGGETFDVKFDASAEALKKLQKVIDDTGIAACNGRRAHTDGVEMYGGSLEVVYASGERLSASDNAGIPFRDAVVPFCSLFEKLAGEAGMSWLSSGAPTA